MAKQVMLAVSAVADHTILNKVMTRGLLCMRSVGGDEMPNAWRQRWAVGAAIPVPATRANIMRSLAARTPMNKILLKNDRFSHAYALD